jgi:hypothetical protein
MKVDKPEKIVGYVLLTVGLIFIILPIWLAIAILLGMMKVPQLIQMPAEGATDGFTPGSVAFSNACLIFFILIILVWGGSIISSRGVALIKEAKFKVTRESLGEGAELTKEEKPEKSA